MTVQITLHALIGNALIHVLLIMFVLQMPYVPLPDTNPFVLVLMAILVVQKLPARFVSKILIAIFVKLSMLSMYIVYGKLTLVNTL